MIRIKKINQFLENSNLSDFTVKKIAGDASFRNYYRVFRKNQPNLIVMDAPPELEDIVPFIKIDKILRENNFLAPEILAIDKENGFLLLEDFGDLSYTKALKNLKTEALAEKEIDLYKKACGVLIDLHDIKIQSDISLYDEQLLIREVMLFIDWYLPFIAKKPATKEQIDLFRQLFIKLFQKLSSNKVLVLRDYHADNLFVVDGSKVALIDFQDAVLGSKAYDLVSLLEDARRDVSQNTVDEMINHYLKKSNCNKTEFLTDYAILSLQRNIKIVGIFSRLAIRDKKEEYLKFLPKMFGYIKKRLQDELFLEIDNLFNNF